MGETTMGFFGFLLWALVLWFAFKTWRRWERRRWGTVGPRGYGPYSGWFDSGEFYGRRPPKIEGKRRESVDDQQAYIDALETRVTELEERLDFTERLLAERREPASQASE
jgi:hypothetical protein